jgi:hypothetical protein
MQYEEEADFSQTKSHPRSFLHIRLGKVLIVALEKGLTLPQAGMSNYERAHQQQQILLILEPIRLLSLGVFCTAQCGSPQQHQPLVSSWWGFLRILVMFIYPVYISRALDRDCSQNQDRIIHRLQYPQPIVVSSQRIVDR